MERARVLAAVASIVLIGATLSPLLRDPTDDGFPLDEFFLDFASPFTLSGPDGTLAGIIRPRHLVP